MNKRKLNYRFHNPNLAEDTAEFLCKILTEANADKVECAIEKAASRCAEEGECIVEPEKMSRRDIADTIAYICGSKMHCSSYSKFH